MPLVCCGCSDCPLIFLRGYSAKNKVDLNGFRSGNLTEAMISNGKCGGAEHIMMMIGENNILVTKKSFCSL